MSPKNSILLTLSQIAIGCVITAAGGLVYFLIFNKFIWQTLIDSRIVHGFWVGLLLLISIGCSYGVIVVGVSEGIRFVGRKFGINVPFKSVCSGAFLGAPAIVGLLALLNIPWDDLQTQNLVVNSLIPVFEIVAFILSLPVRVWIMLRFPEEILYIIAVPIGAILGYRLSKIENVETNVQET